METNLLIDDYLLFVLTGIAVLIRIPYVVLRKGDIAAKMGRKI